MSNVKAGSRSATDSFGEMFDFCLVLLIGSAAIYASSLSIGAASVPLDCTALLFINSVFLLLGIAVSLKSQTPLFFVSYAFCLLFFVFAPLYQTALAPDPIFFESGVFRRAAFLCLAFTAILLGVQMWGRARGGAASTASKFPIGHLWVGRDSLLICAIVAASLASFLLFGDALFTSRNAFSILLYRKFDPATGTLVAVVLMSMPFYGSVVGLRSAMHRRRWNLAALYVCLLLVGLILNNPTITPRYKIVGLILFAVLFLLGTRNVRKLSVIVMSGIVVAPLMHVFRLGVDRSTTAAKGDLLSNTFLSMDYDAFQMLCYSIRRVDEVGTTLGANLFGAVFFFVPRQLWPDKPNPSSFDVALTVTHYRSIGTPNLSTPLPAEGYLAGGVLGAIILMAGYALLIRRLTTSSGNESIGQSLATAAFAGLIFILLRGSLMVGTAYSVGALVAVIIPALLFQPAWFLPGTQRRTSTSASFRSIIRLHRGVGTSATNRSHDDTAGR